jgi:hypothetical protein
LNIEIFQRLTVRHRGKEAEDEAALTPRQQMRERISRRAALEFHDNMYGILGQHYNQYTCTIVFSSGECG